MPRTLRLSAAVLLMFVFLPLNAANLVRDSKLVASAPIQGVTFDMSPQQAFEHLYGLGFKAGSIASFDEWQQDGIEFVRGSYDGPAGESRITMSRKDGRITHLSETWNRPRDKFNAVQEIDKAKAHFGIAAEEGTCKAVSDYSGNCRVQDAEDPHDVDLVYGLQILPGMMNRYVESKKAYAAD